MSRRRVLVTALFGLALVLTAGCGAGHGGRAPVRGTVRLDGEPVDGGAIVFLPEGDGDRPRTGARIEAGAYQIPAEKGPLPGLYRVEIRWPKKTGRKVPSDDPPNLMDETRQVVPARYNARSELTREVRAGMNVFDFELKSK